VGFLVWGGDWGIRVLDDSVFPDPGEERLPPGWGMPIVWVGDSKMESIKATLKTLESIDANLRENGYTTKYCTQVTGASGISYDIDLWATNPAKNDSILVETYLLEETINVDEILRLQALGYDLGAKKIVILTYSKLDQKAEYLANYYGMKRIIPEKTGEVTKEIMVELI
jgi:hypothetical protein